jgi:hypothetical protein
VSAASPATGAEADGARSRTRRAADGPVAVRLEHGRWRHLGWAVFGAVLGSLLVWKLGVLGKVVGVVLVAFAVRAGYRFARTLLHEAGRIEVGDEAVVLPAGLCRGAAQRFPLAEVRHAFFLRRAAPWTRAAPVLVIEAGDQSFTYPRDWFAAESDQRRIAHAILRHLGKR